MSDAPTRNDRLSGGLIGLLVGDAVGVPYEFHNAGDIPPLAEIELDPPAGFPRAHGGTPTGTWSDDGAQALCLLASLQHCDGFDPRDFANRLINWFDHGYMAVDGRVFDVGVQTARAIERLKRGIDPLEAGGADQYSQGNGSLMRVLPLVLWHRGSDAELVQIAHAQSRVTHGHPVVLACCALYCLWARRLLEGAKDGWDDAVAALRSVYGDDAGMLEVLDGQVRPEAERVPRGSGYVIDSLVSARHALAAGPYEAVVKTAISLGQDTDTTACIAGGLAGIRDGLDAIPRRWTDRLRSRQEADGLLGPLLAGRAA